MTTLSKTAVTRNTTATLSKTTPFKHRGHIFSRLNSLRECANYEEAIEKAGMGFTAFKKPLLIPKEKDFDGIKFTKDPQYYLNPESVSIHHEDGTYLSTVGKNYGIVQYRDIFQFCDVMVAENDIGYQYGGTSGGGAQAYLVMKSAEYIELSPQDRIECYFYFVSSHNRSTGLNLIPSPLRTANNTVMLLPKMTAIKFRHSKNVGDRLQKAKESLVKIRKYFNEFEESFKRLSKVNLTTQLYKRYLDLLFPDSNENSAKAQNIKEKIQDIMATEPSLQFPSTKGTLLGAYFSVIQYADHYNVVRKTGKKDETTARIESSIGINGAVARRKAEALATALTFA